LFISRLELKRKLNISGFREFIVTKPKINVSNSNIISPYFYILIQNKSNYIINDLKLKIISISSTNNPDFHSQINGLFIRTNSNEIRPNESDSFESISFSDPNGVYINTIETTSIYLDHDIYHLELQLFYNYWWKIFSNTKFTVIIDYSESKPKIYIPTL
jgi:hypothetical protein